MSFCTAVITVGKPLAVTVPPASVKALAPPEPTTVTWLLVEPDSPWTRISLGIAALGLPGRSIATLFAWPAGNSIVTASAGLKVALLRTALPTLS